ncbi:MAG: methionyl-tRNA formyltransferase [Sphingomonadaceae bacterium]
MRIAFMGTPDFAVPALEALVSAGHEIAAVYCQPPRPAGRGKAPRPSPIQLRAESFGLPVRSPVSLRDPDEQAAFAALDLEAAVVAAYGLILPVPVLEAPRHGCFNIHASLLPRWRGAAPVVRAILAGDEKTGVTIMQMEKGLDTGPMLATADTAVDRKTGGALTEELAEAGAGLMVRVLADLSAFPARAQPVEGVSYAAKIDKSEARIDFSAPAEQVERQIRGFNPVPGAFFELKGERIRVLAAEIVARDGEPGEVVDDALTIACESGAIRPTLVQRAGRGAMGAADLLRGFAIPPGTRLA